MNDVAPSRLRNGSRLAGYVQSQAAAGFTIVETLIALAVSSLLFASVVLMVTGQQQKVEFSQAAQDIKSVIDKTISEVGSGYYPNPGNIRCVVAGGTLNITAATGTQQGSNTGCIFLGKAMQFGIRDTDPQQYAIHTVAGLQDNAGTLASAKPKAVDITAARETDALRNGLYIVSAKYVSGGVRTDIGAVAFVSSLGEFDSGNQLLSGNQQVIMVPVRNSGTVPTTTTAGVVGAIEAQLATSPVNPDGGVLLCFSSGGGRSALITLGSNGRSLSTKLDYKNTGDCS